jgi:hypothetical protein
MKLKFNNLHITQSAEQVLLIVEVHKDSDYAARVIVDEIKRKVGKVFQMKISEYRKSRTLTQNAYYWTLLNKLKNVLKTGEDELHITLLQRYGQDQKDENGNTVIFSLRSDISPVGILKYSKVIGTGEVNGTEFTHYKALKGSSEMNTAEMNVLIDGLISECKEVGIETDTPQELERLRGIWSEKQTEQSVRHTEEGQRQSLGA